MQINGLTVLISGNYNAFNEGWNGAGVYMASGCYVSETFKIPVYIGSAQDLQDRIEGDHILTLKGNKHPHNLPFQNSWNKHAENEGFIWFLLESCQPCETLIIEQKYLDLYRPFVDEFGGFNVCHEAKGGMGGRKHTEESKEKLRILNTGENNAFFGKKHSEETKLKISLSRRGRKMPPKSQETRDKLSKSLKGRIFSEEHRRKIGDGHRGKLVSEETRAKMSASKMGKMEKAREFQMKTYTIKSSTGEIIIFTGLKKFCRANNLHVAELRKLFNGQRKIVKGWTIPDKSE